MAESSGPWDTALGPHPSLRTLGPGGGDLTEALKLSPLPDGGSWGKRLKWNPTGSQSHLTNPYPAKKAGGTGTKGASGLRVSLQQRSLMAVLTLVRYLTAPGSEHLRQMRKSPAVGNGRQGQQQEAPSFCPLVGSCSGHQMAPMPSAGSHTAAASSGARGASSEGPTELLQTHDIPAGPMPQIRKVCSLLSTQIHTSTGRGLWEKLLYTKSPFSGVQGF